MAIFGYARVSSVNQNDDRQMIAMSELGIPTPCVFTDKQSGKDFERPVWKTDMKIATFYRRLRELRVAGKRNATIKKPHDDIDITTERNHPDEVAEMPQASATDAVGIDQFENSHVLQSFTETPVGEKKKSYYQKVPLIFRYSAKFVRARQAVFYRGG